jgi:polyprenyl-phospho-N-acetylgalactosaminyl synthase
MVTVIIPAYNEEATVAEAVAAAKKHPKVTEVIVVDDASTDATSGRAREAGALVIRLAENLGKAGAMEAGVLAAKSDILLFLDADVIGYTPEKISRIIDPVLSGKREMYVAVRARRTIFLNRLLRIFPILGGERALTRSLWNAVPKERRKGFEIEIALNYASKQTEKGMGFELIYGLRHIIKEKKYGFFVGFYRRLKMIVQVSRVSIAVYGLEPLKSLVSRLLKPVNRV